MNTEEYLNKLHKEIVFILEEVVRICENHKLKYYLIGGTLLGAVRHKGFIPWDDDLDIAMPREDFEKFTEIYYRELRKPYSLSWFSTEKNYNHIFAKVYNYRTSFIERTSKSTISSRGIFIDIFPIDISRGYSCNVIIRKKIVNQLNRLISQKYYENEFKGMKKIFLHYIKASTLNDIAIKIIKSFTKDGRYYSNYGSQYSIKRQTHLINNFGEGTMLPFEGKKYRCPTKYTTVLTSIYGPDYMQLPPLNKRRTHYPVRVVFSDGQEMVFKNRKQILDDRIV